MLDHHMDSSTSVPVGIYARLVYSLTQVYNIKKSLAIFPMGITIIPDSHLCSFPLLPIPKLESYSHSRWILIPMVISDVSFKIPLPVEDLDSGPPCNTLSPHTSALQTGSRSVHPFSHIYPSVSLVPLDLFYW